MMKQNIFEQKHHSIELQDINLNGMWIRFKYINAQYRKCSMLPKKQKWCTQIFVNED